MEATEIKTKVFVHNVFDASRYYRFRDELISDPSIISEEYNLSKHAPVTFVRISKHLKPRQISHSKKVYEVITNCREDLIGHNVICAYFEDDESVDIRLLREIYLRMKSRFGKSMVIFREIPEFGFFEL